MMKEFDFINALKNRMPIMPPHGIGDDAALLGDFLITTDIMTEGVHFLPAESDAIVMLKLFEANMSDIAAMGGHCDEYHALMGVGMAPSTDMASLAVIIADICEACNIRVIGGDTVASGGNRFYSLTLIGKRGKNILTRHGAQPGDIVYVSRPLGGARYAFEKRLSGKNVHLTAPAERVLGEALGKMEGITACIDISDGLGRDLSHIAESSGVHIEIDSNKLPLWGEVSTEYAVGSGEEYALAFTVRPACAQNVPAGLCPIGIVMEGSGVFMDGKDISQEGYEHGN